MITLKLISLILVLLVTIVAGFFPFYKRLKTQQKVNFPVGESLAAGVFLGAGLMHMLGDSSSDFFSQGYDYPFAFLIAGAAFLVFLLLEHIGRELYQKIGESSGAFAVLAMVMLSIHSFFTGAALGLSGSTSVVIVVLLAILAHKWAASFALAVQINKSNLPMKIGVMLFAIFALMVPLGIFFGDVVTVSMSNHPLLHPIFTAIAAGTFLYLGTLHGLEQATLVKPCCGCGLNRFYYVIVGFVIMAVVAIWT